MEKKFHANGNEEKAEVAIVIADKINFKTGHNKRYRGAFRNDKGVNPTRGYNSCSIYMPNTEAPKYISKY